MDEFKKTKIRKTSAHTPAKAPLEADKHDDSGAIERFIVHHIKEPSGYSAERSKAILNHLVKLGILTEVQQKTISTLHRESGESITKLILDSGALDIPNLGRAMADFFKVPYIAVKGQSIAYETLNILPEDVAQKEGAIVFAETRDQVSVAMLDPWDQHFLHLLEKKTGKKAKAFYTTPDQIQEALKLYRQSLSENVQHLIARAAENISHLESLSSISSIFDTLVLMAYYRNASDIHMEPYEKEIRIRFRVDGVLGQITTLPISFLETLVNHVKVISRLRTDLHSSAQDGRFALTYDQTTINFRVSVVPTYHGEKIVMRLLPVEGQTLTLERLGYEVDDRATIERNSKKSSGMLLVTGPTGSGKTTTLYAILKELNQVGVNISTIEDPIEYGLEGVNQMQVNPKTNITFAEGLKSLLRQDPDILMIGEIRDLEIAKIAAQAALTGHLVLATLHTNNAALAPLRLVQMGLDPYLIVSTLNVIVAQRLVRRVCTDCMVSKKLTKKAIETIQKNYLHTDEERAVFNKYFSIKKEESDDEVIRLFVGKGCKKCGDSGYLGRVVIAETLEMKDDIRSLVTGQASQHDIEKAAQQGGMTTMLEDGLKKVLAGVTTLDELFRVLNQ